MSEPLKSSIGEIPPPNTVVQQVLEAFYRNLSVTAEYKVVAERLMKAENLNEVNIRLALFGEDAK